MTSRRPSSRWWRLRTLKHSFLYNFTLLTPHISSSYPVTSLLCFLLCYNFLCLFQSFVVHIPCCYFQVGVRYLSPFQITHLKSVNASSRRCVRLSRFCEYVHQIIPMRLWNLISRDCITRFTDLIEFWFANRFQLLCWYLKQCNNCLFIGEEFQVGFLENIASCWTPPKQRIIPYWKIISYR